MQVQFGSHLLISLSSCWFRTQLSNTGVEYSRPPSSTPIWIFSLKNYSRAGSHRCYRNVTFSDSMGTGHLLWKSICFYEKMYTVCCWIQRELCQWLARVWITRHINDKANIQKHLRAPCSPGCLETHHVTEGDPELLLPPLPKAGVPGLYHHVWFIRC